MASSDSRLTLTREISRSGIATVWEAYDAGLDRKVLVKSIHPQYARESDLRARFEREARAIARLSHPNVVQIYDLRVDEDELAIILEFVEGVTLGKLLKEHGALPAEVAVTIAAEILAGLEQAHAAGIVHRDLKPDNVLVSRRGEVKITDFGLASLRDQPTVTQEGMVVGTPSYMAPEQATGGEVSAATDLFASGLILFEMLTGNRLIEGASLGEAFQNVLRYTQPRLEPFRDSISPKVEPVLRRLLDRQPEKRYASAGEARVVLIATEPGGILPRALIADFLSGEPIHRTSVQRPVRRPRSRVLQAVLMVLLLALVAGGGYYWTRFRRVPAGGQADSTRSQMVSVDTTGAHPAKTDSAGQLVEPVGDTAVVVYKNPAVHPEPQPGPSEPPAPSLDPATIEITSRPWASVYLGDSLVGTTPLASPVRLAPGDYDLVLLNPEIGFPVMRKVTARAGETSELRVNLYDSVARIRVASVKPWADVYVDGKFEMRTPSSKVIFRPLGLHTITLKHPDYPEYSKQVSFGQSDPIYEIRIDLTQL
jgi:serine/threonine protein kinase